MKKRPSSGDSSIAPIFKKQQTASIFSKPQAKQDSMYQVQPSLVGGRALHAIHGNWQANKKIAAFDLDGTVIIPKGGRSWPKDASDWQYWHSSVPTALRNLQQDGFSIIFISNQAGQPHVQRNFVEKLGLLGTALGVPFQAFAAFEYDQFRKPCPGFWERFVQEFNQGIEIDYAESFYCGDAAGRPLNSKTGAMADHSDVDRKMSQNAGLQFYTPEERFLSRPIDNNWEYDRAAWNPAEYNHDIQIFTPTNSPLIPRGANKKQEVIFFVGPPAIGKTFFFNHYFAPAGYISVNPDATSRAISIAALETALSSSSTLSVVIESRLPAIASRSQYLSFLKRDFPNVTIRAFWFDSPLVVAKHNSFYRAVYGEDVEERKKGVVAMSAFDAYATQVKVPTENEGFSEVKKISFSFVGSDAALANWGKDLTAYKKQKAGAGHR